MLEKARRPGAVDRFIAVTEKAAGIFLAAVTVLVFVNVMLRGATSGGAQFLNWLTSSTDYRYVLTIPEWFHLSCLMLGVCIFWGLAATSYRNDHIKVDILWETLGPRGKWIVDLLATGILLAFLAVFAAMLVDKVISGYWSGESTYDLRLKIWPFHLVMTAGIFFATALVAIRLMRLIHGTNLEREHKVDFVE